MHFFPLFVPATYMETLVGFSKFQIYLNVDDVFFRSFFVIKLSCSTNFNTLASNGCLLFLKSSSVFYFCFYQKCNRICWHPKVHAVHLSTLKPNQGWKKKRFDLICVFSIASGDFFPFFYGEKHICKFFGKHFLVKYVKNMLNGNQQQFQDFDGASEANALIQFGNFPFLCLKVLRIHHTKICDEFPRKQKISFENFVKQAKETSDWKRL